MIIPSLTINEDGGTWGLKKWKDGFTGLCKRHSSGDWFLVRPATVREIKVFETHGEEVGK